MDFMVSSIYKIALKFQYLFYIVNPYDCMYSDVKHVPRYVEEVII